MSINSNMHFSKAQIWANYDSEGSIVDKKLPWVLKNIPQDVKSILDVGCGNGIITNVLSQHYQVQGADMSAAALKQVTCPSVQCSSDSIPVATESVDMVFSSQLLEHLTDHQLAGTINEFKRIARKYVLITVPNQEFLKICEAKCPRCNHVFNTDGHYQSFDKRRLEQLFADEFELVHHDVGGNYHRGYNSILMNIKQVYGNRYFNPVRYTMCPNCKNDDFPMHKGNLVSKVCNGLNRIVSTQSPYWLLTLLRKKNDDHS